MDRAVIFGASRGLGAELAKVAAQEGYPALGFGRKADRLQALRDTYPLFEYQIADLSQEAGQVRAIQTLLEGNFSKVFFVLGGGPYGPFEKRSWESHVWALQVTFLFQARALHALMANGLAPQTILIGSSVAEATADPGATSYAAGKHALLGLYQSLRCERPEWDLRLFSPGYMDTDMLPANAAVRQQGVFSPAEVARELWIWSLSADYGGHKVYSAHPS